MEYGTSPLKFSVNTNKSPSAAEIKVRMQENISIQGLGYLPNDPRLPWILSELYNTNIPFRLTFRNGFYFLEISNFTDSVYVFSQYLLVAGPEREG